MFYFKLSDIDNKCRPEDNKNYTNNFVFTFENTKQDIAHECLCKLLCSAVMFERSPKQSKAYIEHVKMQTLKWQSHATTPSQHTIHEC